MPRYIVARNLAGATLAALPTIVFFLLFQRYFPEGVRMGALKG